MCGGGDDCFVVLACESLEVVGDDFCGVAVECAAEFVEYPPLFAFPRRVLSVARTGAFALLRVKREVG